MPLHDDPDERSLTRHDAPLADLVSAARAYVRSRPPSFDRDALLARMDRTLAEACVATLVDALDEGLGAARAEVLLLARREGITHPAAEQALVALVDAGVLYEPARGKLKRA